MIIKLAGAGAVILSMWVYGWYMAEYIKKRMNELREIKKAFTMFADETLYSGGELCGVFQSVGQRCEGKANEMFLETANMLLEKNCDSASDAWEEVTRRSCKDSFLDAEDIENIVSFGRCLGFSGMDMQVSNVKIAVNYIDLKVDELNKKYAEQNRLYKNLGLMAGMLTVVVIF